jgi:uncharacterized Zn finger protein
MTDPAEERSGGDPGPGRSAPAISTALLLCENCGRETMHRVLRLQPTASTGRRAVRGVARCRECRWTHPFESVPEVTVDVPIVISTREVSSRRTVPLPAHRRLQVGSGVPGFDPGLRIRRIDRRDGRQVPEARVDGVSTLWVTPVPGSSVPLSIVEGRRTRTTQLDTSPDTMFEVGDRFTFEGLPLWVSAVRARGHTWRHSGDAFPAIEVDRVYARRTATPPAGRSDWRSDREMPSSADNERSRSGRSRSSPGTRRARTDPRARTDRSGAAVHRSSPSY